MSYIRRIQLAPVIAALCTLSIQLGSEVLRRRAAVAAVPPDLRGKLTIFILAGQSNMRAGDSAPELAAEEPQIFLFDYNFRWLQATTSDGGVVQANPKLGAGSGLAFAQQLRREDPTLTIGLVQCAQNGSSMSEWIAESERWTIYPACIERATRAMEMGDIAGVLVFQGEAEGLDLPRYAAASIVPERWGADFLRLVDAFRADLGEPRLPVIFAQIGQTTRHAPYWEVVKAQQRAVDHPCVAMITSDDLPLRDDVHFTSNAYQTLGRRYAEAYGLLLEGCAEG